LKKQQIFSFFFFCFVVLNIESSASCILNTSSTTELFPQPCFPYLKAMLKVVPAYLRFHSTTCYPWSTLKRTNPIYTVQGILREKRETIFT
jgi:hypothetical protein